MSLLKFLAANWDSAAVILVVIAAVMFLVFKKQWGLLDKMLFALVTWAEREYGGGTGSLKLAAVIERIYPHIPAVVRWFVTAGALVGLVEKALAQAKDRWDKNPALLTK